MLKKIVSLLVMLLILLSFKDLQRQVQQKKSARSIGITMTIQPLIKL